jgi:hypothetical protein
VTEYVVLCRAEDQPASGPLWEQWQTVEAHSAEAAIREAFQHGDGGTFIAIPLRSFQPVAVTATRTVKLAPVSAGEPKGDE